MEIKEYTSVYLKDVNKMINDNFFHTLSNIKEDDRTIPYVCVDSNNQAVGFFVLTKVLNIVRDFNYYLLDYVCTDIDHQGMGIGNVMLKFISEKADRDQVEYVQLTCNNKRECARHLYEKYGFELLDTNVFRRVRK